MTSNFQTYHEQTPADVKEAKVGQDFCTSPRDALKWLQLSGRRETGPASPHAEHSQRPESPDLPWRTSYNIWHRMDHNSDVSITKLILACWLAGFDWYDTNVSALHSDTSTNEQKKGWFLSLNPNGEYNFPTFFPQGTS